MRARVLLGAIRLFATLAPCGVGCQSLPAVPADAGAASASAAHPLSPPPDPAGLAELLAASRADKMPEGAEDRIGKPTGTIAPPDDQAAGPNHAGGRVGSVTREAQVAPAAIERRARRELYYPLVRRCSPPKGLPPDAVIIDLELGPDGRIEPGSVQVSASAPEHAGAAACMRKELAATSFHGPVAARGVRTPIRLTVPSVD